MSLQFISKAEKDPVTKKLICPEDIQLIDTSCFDISRHYLDQFGMYYLKNS